MPPVTKPACFLSILLLVACTPAKPPIPPLTEQTATELLNYNHKAENWMKYVQKNNKGCGYRLDIPDQSSHPTEIDLDHIVWCGNRPSPREFDASVSFEYDKNAQHWVITRFAS